MALCLLIVIQLLAFFSFKKNLCCMLFKIVVGIVGIAGSESLLFYLVMALEIVLERTEGKTKAA